MLFFMFERDTSSYKNRSSSHSRTPIQVEASTGTLKCGVCRMITLGPFPSAGVIWWMLACNLHTAQAVSMAAGQVSMRRSMRNASTAALLAVYKKNT